MPQVLIVRGHQATPWELRPWLELPPRYEVSLLVTGSNRFALPDGLRQVRVRALRDMLPGGLLGEVGTHALGDRYIGAEEAFRSAEIVHAEELSYWFAAEAAKRKRRHGFRLAQTVWETLPLLDAYRNGGARRHRALVLSETDLFLPTTERAAATLRLEGVSAQRMMLCPPGIDAERFSEPQPGDPPQEHTVLSIGRLVWEKGHHDVLRAIAALHNGIVTLPSGAIATPRLRIVGAGPEQSRLSAHAAELGLAGHVDIESLPYEQMPRAFASASAMVLASQSSATAAYHPFDVPHAFWEEQFGMVLAEAMAARLAIVTSTSGAIPEVVRGTPVDLVAPGDWLGVARALAAGPLSRPPAERVSYPAEIVERYSTAAAAGRLAEAYDRLLAKLTSRVQHVKCATREPIPGELARADLCAPAQLRSALLLAEHAHEAGGDALNVMRVYVLDGVTADLWQRREVGRDHGCARRHRLEHRQPESLAERGVAEDGAPPVELRKRCIRYVAQHRASIAKRVAARRASAPSPSQARPRLQVGGVAAAAHSASCKPPRAVAGSCAAPACRLQARSRPVADCRPPADPGRRRARA